MDDAAKKFFLPARFQEVINPLKSLYRQTKDSLRLALIEKGTFSFSGGESVYHSWDDENHYEHKLSLSIPEELYDEIVIARDETIVSLKNDINSMIKSSLGNDQEYIGTFSINIATSTKLSENTKNDHMPEKIWKKNHFKLFISHSTADKKIATELSAALSLYGISSFVAHENIEPSTEWIEEIEKALNTADAFLAFLTKDFEESKWCDQESGIAYGRDIFIFPVKINCDPYGFINKYQALQFSPETEDSLNYLVNKLLETMLADKKTKKLLIIAMINKLIVSSSYKETNNLLYILNRIQTFPVNLPQDLILKFKEACEKNKQIFKPNYAKKILPSFLKKISRNAMEKKTTIY